jgi:hypothetical protein
MAPAFSHLADRQCGLAGRASGPGSLAAPNAQRNLGPHGDWPPLISWNPVKTFRRHGPLRNDPLPLRLPRQER